MPQNRFIRRTLTCGECSSRYNLWEKCDRPLTGKDCKKCIEKGIVCKASREEEVLAHFRTLHASLVPQNHAVQSAFETALEQHLLTNSLIFSTVMQFTSLQLEDFDMALKCCDAQETYHIRWVDRGETDGWQEDIKPYLLYLIIVGPAYLAMLKSSRTMIHPDPAAHIAVVTRKLCSIWAKVNSNLDILNQSIIYRNLLQSNFTGGHTLTSQSLQQLPGVISLRTLVDRHVPDAQLRDCFYGVINNIYRITGSMLRAQRETENGKPENINRFIPAWLAINKALPSQFWDFVNAESPQDIFRVILCHWGVLCYRAKDVWWCEGIHKLLFDSFRERLRVDKTLRSNDEYLDAMKIVAAFTDNQEAWMKFG